MKITLAWLAIFHAVKLLAEAPAGDRSGLSFAITFNAEKSASPLDGRLLLLLSSDQREEPRFQINDSPKTQIVFGLDVEDWKPGEARIVDAATPGMFGYPVRSLGGLQPGEYRVQALLDRYETFQRTDGHTLKLPTDRGEGRQWNRAVKSTFTAERWTTSTSTTQ